MPDLSWMRGEETDRFVPRMIHFQQQSPSPLPGVLLYVVLTLFAAILIWSCVGRLDIVAVAQGRLVPRGFLKIVQPSEAGIVQEILVKEGDLVREGQILARMDTHVSEADGKALLVELYRKRLQLRGIEAELSGVKMKRQTDDPEDIYTQTEVQFQARRRAYLDALGAEQATLLKAQHDLKGAVATEHKLQKAVPIYKDQADSWDKLAKEGFAGRLLALDRQRAYLESEQDLKTQAHNVESLKALISQSEMRLAQITSNYRQQLQNERSEAEASYNKLQQSWDKQQYRHALLDLRAPQAGLVKDLATHTPGTVVAPGTILLTLVPRDEPLIAEVWVSNADAGLVRSEQKVRIKLAAYPFQKFGTLEGVVRQVSADAQERSDSSSSTKPFQEAAYRALIDLSGPGYLESQGRHHKLVPGMLLNAEIHLGSRSVIEYLLSPIQKVAYEAGREI